MHGILNSIDAAAAAEAAQMLEGAVEARELLQGMIDKISGATQFFCPVIVALGLPDAYILSDKYSSNWADICLRSCSSSCDLGENTQVLVGRQRLKLSFKATPPPAGSASISAAAIAAAATAAAAAAVAAVKTADSQHLPCRESRGKVAAKSTSDALEPLPAAQHLKVCMRSLAVAVTSSRSRSILFSRPPFMAFSSSVCRISTMTLLELSASRLSAKEAAHQALPSHPSAMASRAFGSPSRGLLPMPPPLRLLRHRLVVQGFTPTAKAASASEAGGGTHASQR
jgi:hypothetical protein